MQKLKTTELELPKLKQARVVELRDCFIFEARKGAGCVTAMFEKPGWTLQRVINRVKDEYGQKTVTRRS